MIKRSFTSDEYCGILYSLHKKGYEFVDYDDGGKVGTVIIRHDVDLCLNSAVSMANLDNQYGVNSTFFLMMGSPFYNIFSQKGREAVLKIMSYNHHIGLHFDIGAYLTSFELEKVEESEISIYDLLLEMILSEIETIEEFFGLQQRVRVVSFHKPDEYLYKHVVTERSGLINASKYNSATYLADSACQWQYGHPLERAEFVELKPLHLNFHPIWWNELAAGSSFNIGLDKLNEFHYMHNLRMKNDIAKACAKVKDIHKMVERWPV